MKNKNGKYFFTKLHLSCWLLIISFSHTFHRDAYGKPSAVISTTASDSSSSVISPTVPEHQDVTKTSAHFPWALLKPSANMKGETLAMKHCLENIHYAKKPTYQLAAEDILENYFTHIDNSHMLFLEPEIRKITQDLSPKLHSFLQRGDLTKAFEIFDLYRRHIWERIEWILREIPHLDLQSLSKENFRPYREELPWPQDTAAADHLWKQRLIYEIQSEILSLQNSQSTFSERTPFCGIFIHITDDPKTNEPNPLHIFSMLKTFHDEKHIPFSLVSYDGTTSHFISWIHTLKVVPEPPERLPSQAIIDQAKAHIAKRYESFQCLFSDIEPWFVQELFINSLAQLYDPHSSFLSKDSFEEFNVILHNALVGIGAYLYYDNGYCTIKELTPGGPAARSQQLHPGDRIVAVAEDGQEAVEITGMPSYRSVRLIRGTKGTRVHLTIEPAEGDAADRRIITLVRDTISIESAHASAKLFTLTDQDKHLRVGYIYLPSFYGPDENSKVSLGCTEDVRQLLKELKSRGMQGLILDLRGNGGGLLEQSITLASLFIPNGPIVQVRDPEGRTEIYSSHNSTLAWDGPMITLISRQSVSASEILAGALREHGRSIIVGDKSTHGKGSVQVLIPLENFLGSWLGPHKGSMGAARVTVNKWYRPSGSSIQLHGVASDIPLPSFDEWVPIGESDLPHALPWDAIIPPSSSKPFVSDECKHAFDQLIAKLHQRSISRQQTLSEFMLLDTRIQLFRQKLNHEEFSLDMFQRLQERRKDTKIQRRIQEEMDVTSAQSFYASIPIKLPSQSDHPVPEKTYHMSEDPFEEDNPASTSTSKEYDTHLRESLRIMRDWIDEIKA
ncbi:MAG: carboxy terminal-processing peptidase [Puniceicoccales bacterium]|nr:carboxy terminal-processing peptidase [Puniceicoccales bacterium]